MEDALSTPAVPLVPLMRVSDAPLLDRPVAGVSVARRHLLGADADLARWIRRTGRCGLRADVAREPVESLLRAVAHQQLHARAAEAMLKRLSALLPNGLGAPESLLALPDGALRACGFSANKSATLRTICQARLDGIVPTRREARRLTDDALIERLVGLRGIGRWTVEMLLIFSLGRPDVMPVDDFGVREGFRLIKQLPRQPTPKALRDATVGWGPFRSFAAWYLWRAADAAKPAKASAPDRKRADDVNEADGER